MVHNSGTYRIEVYVNEASNQMLACFHRCRMITVFPVSSFSTLPDIEFLPGPLRDQLNGFGDHISITLIPDKQMDVITSHRIVEYAKAIAFFGFNFKRNSFL